MSSRTAGGWLGRLAALAAAIVIPACGSVGSPGGANPNGIFWNSQGTTNPPQGDAPTRYWIDPNQGVVGPIGISNIIHSADDATYDGWYPGGQGGLIARITYIQGNLHPLSTDTGTTSITLRENQLQQQINAYRQQKLGNAVTINGGVAIGGIQGALLSGHFRGTKAARAHCKHYALFHGGFPAGANAEKDDLQKTAGQANPFGTPAPGNPDGDKGRLGKIGIVAQAPVLAGNSIVFSGAQYGDPDAVFAQLVLTQPKMLVAAWTNVAVGHWRGGPNVYYWNIIFLLSPIPGV